MLNQAEADRLMAVAKRVVGRATIEMAGGCDYSCDVEEVDGPEKFILDLARGRLRLSKLKFQNRARTVEVLIRLDVNGPPHTNPDGVQVGGSHLHRYREGYEARWAEELNSTDFPDLSDIQAVYQTFCRLCNLTPVMYQGTI